MSVLTFDRTGKLKPPHWYKEGGRGGGCLQTFPWVFTTVLQYVGDILPLIDSLSS